MLTQTSHQYHFVTRLLPRLPGIFFVWLPFPTLNELCRNCNRLSPFDFCLTRPSLVGGSVRVRPCTVRELHIQRKGSGSVTVRTWRDVDRTSVVHGRFVTLRLCQMTPESGGLSRADTAMQDGRHIWTQATKQIYIR